MMIFDVFIISHNNHCILYLEFCWGYFPAIIQRIKIKNSGTQSDVKKFTLTPVFGCLQYRASVNIINVDRYFHVYVIYCLTWTAKTTCISFIANIYNTLTNIHVLRYFSIAVNKKNE